MNRLKLWGYMVLLLGTGALDLRFMSRKLVDRELEAADGRLKAAVALFDARSKLLSRQVMDLADAAARDPAFAEALSPRAPPEKPGKRPRPKPQPRPAPSAAEVQAAAEVAVRQAGRLTGVDVSRGFAVGVARGEHLAFRAGGKPVGGERDRGGHAWLAAARTGSARQGYVRLEEAVYYAAAVSAPGGAALAVAQPLDAAWLASLRAAGPEVTLAADLKQPPTTLSPSMAQAVVAAVKAPGRPVGLGELGPVPGADALPLPAMPLLFASAPAQRAESVALEGLPGASVIFSEAMRPRLAVLAAWQHVAVGAGGVFLVLGLALGVLMPTARRAAQLPKELVSAADQIARGEFDARAPLMAGALGTVAEALNRAAEAAQAASGEAARAPSSSEPLSAMKLPAARAEETGETTAREFSSASRSLSRPAAAPANLSDTSRLDGAELFGTAGPPRAAAASGLPAVAPPSPRAPVARAAAQPLGAANDEQHFREVFDEFVRVRRECGEPLEGLTLDRFRAKLKKNRDSLVQKYSCKAVRFQVYVKDGKAALRATPVR